jgi:hypothetical protein
MASCNIFLKKINTRLSIYDPINKELFQTKLPFIYSTRQKSGTRGVLWTNGNIASDVNFDGAYVHLSERYVHLTVHCT